MKFAIASALMLLAPAFALAQTATPSESKPAAKPAAKSADAGSVKPRTSTNVSKQRLITMAPSWMT